MTERLILYQCAQCRLRVEPTAYARSAGRCACGGRFERVRSSRDGRRAWLARLFSSDAALAPVGALKVVRVIPPRDNLRDTLAITNLFGALRASHAFALELCATRDSKSLLVRADARTMSQLQAAIHGLYPQARFELVAPEDDPTVLRAGEATACAALRLAKPEYLPLRTFRDRDFETSDPLDVIFGTLATLDVGERLVAQLILAPAPKDWGQRYQGSARALEATMQPGMPPHAVGSVNLPALLFWSSAPLLALCALGALLAREWLMFGLALALAVGVSTLLVKVRSLISKPAADPALIQQKVHADARHARIRLFVFGPKQAALEGRLIQAAGAYQQLNLESGNQFEMEWLPTAEATDLVTDPLATWTFCGVSMRPWLKPSWDILNVHELAALWHLPRSELNVPGLRVSDAMQLAPTSDAFAQGTLIGQHVGTDGRTVPIHLPDDATRRHMVMVAKTQYGKSTLIARLAQGLMPDRARGLVVVDPASDLARQLIRLVPRERLRDVVYVNLADEAHPVAFNPLDATLGRRPEKIAADLVTTFKFFWDENWGPRMGEYFQEVAKAMAVANVDIAYELGRPQDQYTLLDMVPVLEQHDAAKRLFGYMQPHKSLDHKQLHDFYENNFLKLWVEDRKEFRQVVLPIIYKMNLFTQYRGMRATLGQALSSVNFSQVVQERKLLIVNCNAGQIGADNAQMMGSIIINAVASAIGEQAQVEEAAERARVTVVIDEFQSYGDSIDIPGFLALLAKYGANFVLATQTLELLHEKYPALYHTLLTNSSSLFAFQTSFRDAETLSREMGSLVPPRDITMLPRWHCYLSAVVNGRKQPPISLETLPPEEPRDATLRAQSIVAESRERFGREIGEIERELLRLMVLKASTGEGTDLGDPAEKY